MNACESCGELFDRSDMVNTIEDFYFCYKCEEKKVIPRRKLQLLFDQKKGA